MVTESQEISILRFFHSLWREKFVLLSVPIFAVILGLIFAFTLPKEYDSSAAWLPNSESSDNGLSGLASLAGIRLGGGSDNESQILPSLLESDSILTKLQSTKFAHSQHKEGLTLVQYLKLEESFLDLDSLAIKPFLREKLLAFIEKKVKLQVSNLISLQVITQDPLFSQELNQFLANQIISINSKIKTLKITRNREFLEAQYLAYSDSLQRTEDDLLEFSLQNAFTSSPALTLEKARLVRKTETFTSITLEMRKQLELARLEEKKQTDHIIFISEPSYAPKPVAPKKKLIIIGFFVLGAFLGLIVAVFKIWWNESGKEELITLTSN